MPTGLRGVIDAASGILGEQTQPHERRRSRKVKGIGVGNKVNDGGACNQVGSERGSPGQGGLVVQRTGPSCLAMSGAQTGPRGHRQLVNGLLDVA